MLNGVSRTAGNSLSDNHTAGFAYDDYETGAGKAVEALARTLCLSPETTGQLVEGVAWKLQDLSLEEQRRIVAGFDELSTALGDVAISGEEEPRAILELVVDNGNPGAEDTIQGTSSLVSEILAGEDKDLSLSDGPSVLPRRPSSVTRLDGYRQARQEHLDNETSLKLVAQAKEGDHTALGEIWLDAIPTAQHIVNASTIKSRLARDDRVQACLMVVPRAVELYDASRGSAFSSYLYRRMKGAIIDAEREHFESLGLDRADYIKLQKALRSDDPQVSLSLLSGEGFTQAQYLVDEDTVVSTAISFERLTEDTEPSSGDDVAEEAARNERTRKLQALVEDLPDRERFVVTVANELFGSPYAPYKDIAEIMGVTVSRVSQIHCKAMKKLTWLLERNYEAFGQE